VGMGGGEAAQDLQGAAHEAEEEEEECPVCLIPISLEETCRDFQCAHIFHRVCAARWRTTCAGDPEKNTKPVPFTCPTCRAVSVAVAQEG
jgi:hypothetical protein